MYYNNYEFDENKNYLIYFRGGFCPPTKGHVSLVEKYIDLPNVKYFLHQIGDEKRHGVPYWLNRKIWKIYIHELFPKDKIILRKMASSLEVLDHIENVDVVILIKGNEGMNEEEEYKLKTRYYPLKRELKKKGLLFHFLIIDRPELNKISATKFVDDISKGKSGYQYIPRKLSKKASKYIIHKLKKFV